MATRQTKYAVRGLHVLFNVGSLAGLSDGQLLERFATGQGEARELAFAALVERHGPLVFGVCRAVLGDEHQADDAFQATFLALAHKAAGLWTRDSLGPWLHQVAYRAACHDRSARLRRQAHERTAAALHHERIEPPDLPDGLERVIHDEIDCLPVRYKAAVVLCDLEGRTHEQAARSLGCAVGTVKSRLARGRERLRGRLMRRGIAPSVALMAATAAPAGSARAGVPAALSESTVNCAAGSVATAGAVPISVATLTSGVLISMLHNKIRFTATATALATSLAAGAIVVAQQTGGQAGPPRDRSQDPVLVRQSDKGAQPSGKPPARAPRLVYEIMLSRDGGEPTKVGTVDITSGIPVKFQAADALITFEPKNNPEMAHLAEQLQTVLRLRLQSVAAQTAREELLAADHKLKQAEVRPAEVRPGKEEPPQAPKTATDVRLENLEQKVDLILDSLKALGNVSPGSRK